MKVVIDPAAAVELRAMPPVPRRRMKQALANLGTGGPGLDIKRLDSDAAWPAFRVRVGDWRAAWYVRNGAIQVVRIFHRREGYGWMERGGA